ncbi:MAG: Smr/MutS family protein [Proteobacteria bacterium]|nr:Smr/MutS family protein [Desulfobacula sp.]MBU3953782.1 Smr/MutS family protein [Pseudomonadota bacterium]
MKNRKKNRKNDLPVLDSDHDFLSMFTQTPLPPSLEGEKPPPPAEKTPPRRNKHGLPVIEDIEGQFLCQDPLSEAVSTEPGALTETEEDFEVLLEASLKERKRSVKKKTIPVPIKKRLKRYPPPEAQLDLHGFTAVGAEAAATSFISTCKHQGYFSLRIIVGKGLHSDMGPVLPDVIEDLLKVLKNQNIVLAYEWDRQKKSKSGAVIVYLKQFND